MSMQIRQPGNYSIPKGEIIFLEGQNTQSLTLLLKGKVDVLLSPSEEYIDQDEQSLLDRSYRIFSIDQNIFIDTTGFFLDGKYSFSLRAAQDSNLYVFPVNDMEQLLKTLHSHKEYSAYAITSMASMMGNAYTALLKLEDWLKKFAILSDNLSLLFWVLKDQYNLTHMPSPLMHEAGEKYQQLKKAGSLPLKFAPQFLDQEISELSDLDYVSLDDTTLNRIEYYQHMYSLPLELKVNFFNSDDYIEQYHFNEATQNLEVIKYCMKAAMRIGEKYFKRIYLKGEPCIFTELVSLINEAKKFNQSSDELLQLLDYLVKKITDFAITFQDEYYYDLQLDIEQMITVSQQLKVLSTTPANHNDINNRENEEQIPEELKDSSEKIIRYSGISNEKAALLRSNLNNFKLLKNNRASATDFKSITSIVTPIFFEIYEMVLKKVLLENNTSKLFEMFLTYGYMDEDLLSSEQVITLYKLFDRSPDSGPCAVYTIFEWLTQIQTLQKDPSINDFGQDYFDIFREMKKKGQTTDKEKAAYDRDGAARLSYEISNMFKTNHKVCHGQVNSYFPILNSAMITKDLSQALVTKDLINEGIRKILEVDFSAFNREIFYQNAKKGIEKELISKAVFPNIILMPTFGCRGSMWQEIAGRVRGASGRFFLPIFTADNLEDLLIKLVGNFRWELCRTMMGSSWNDITEKSLTSEYTDYIQFYKKNNVMSEVAKEKLKAQILRYGSIRDTFSADYRMWIKNESNGNICLNKVARNILYKYCPFEKSIRLRLERQPIFNELATPFNGLRAKKAKELENRYNKLLSNNISSEPELAENLKFYKER